MLNLCTLIYLESLIYNVGQKTIGFDSFITYRFFFLEIMSLAHSTGNNKVGYSD